MPKWVIAFGLCCLSSSLLANESKRYFPLIAEREFYADMASIRPHPDNERLLMVDFINNASKQNKSLVERQHINCTSGTLIRRANGLVKVYDGLYAKGEPLFSYPEEAQQISLSDALTPMNIFSALACDLVGKPLLNDPNILDKMIEGLEKSEE